MPNETPPPAAADDAIDPGAGDAGDEGGATAGAKPSKVYSKAEVDAMVNKAKATVRREYGDYSDLKDRASKYDELQEAAKSNEEKLRERADRATRERDAAITRAKSTMVRSSIIAVASRLGAVDPDAVAALLSHDDLVIEGDEVIGVEEAVKDLMHKKPYLRAGGARAGVEIAGGGTEPEVYTRSQIRQWARTGGLTKERVAKINQAAAEGHIRADR